MFKQHDTSSRHRMVRGRIARSGILTVFVAAIALLLGASTASADVFQTITKSDAGIKYTLPDGTVFYGIDPSDPSTGTGVFQPFVRGQRLGKGPNNIPEGEQTYYNTDGAIEFETKQGKTGGTNWTHSVLLSDISGGDSITLVLDANEPTGHHDAYLNLHLDDMKIYLLDEPDVTGYDPIAGTLGGEAPVWTMDSAINGDVTIDLYADICPVKGQCGSGHGDFAIEIALADFANLDGKYFYWYNENSLAADGFEEWKVLMDPIPEPTAALLFGLGALIFRAGARRRS